MELKTLAFCLIGAFCFLSIRPAVADIPAHCLWEDIAGTWELHEGPRNGSNDIQCDSSFTTSDYTIVELSYPNIVVDQYGNKGTWTLIYDQGFEIIVNGRQYFAYSYFEEDGGDVVTYCQKTSVGWSHDVTSRNWACYYGAKVQVVAPKDSEKHSNPRFKGEVYQPDVDLVNRINAAGTTWKAKLYKEDDGVPMDGFMKKMGAVEANFEFPTPVPASREAKLKAMELPESFDWRNVSGMNYVSPVRNQAQCGSCFAFASAGMMEARVRIRTQNEKNPIFSTQDIVSCTQYAQGCAGGFAYLIAGKYGQDFGMVEEEYNPYQGIDMSCTTPQSAPRHYTAKYEYIGGYYGGSNEENMMEALVNNGPIAIGFMVFSDFYNYRQGVYQHTGLSSKFNPFYVVNHAVLVVGYGTDSESGLKYWIVKNSWGDSWGLDGYFHIRRGTNECGMESIAFEAHPIP